MSSVHTRQVRRNAVRVAVFATVVALFATLITTTLARVRTEDQAEYRAAFRHVSGLVAGSDVRAVGVVVGRVEKLHLREGNQVEVEFTVDDTITLTDRTRARVRYANLTGDRYLELAQRPDEKGTALPVGGLIPSSRTQPALDLDLLFNGFRPLIKALDPQEVNALTGSLIDVSQGQGEAVTGLLRQVSSFTNTLASRDELIGDVITNLSRTLRTVDAHRGDLGRLLDGLQSLVSGLAKDRQVIGRSLVNLDKVTGTAESLLAENRPRLRGTLTQAERMADAFNANRDYADRYLAQVPAAIHTMGRGGAYGSFFNFYICGVRFKLTGPGGPRYTPFQMSKEERCRF